MAGAVTSAELKPAQNGGLAHRPETVAGYVLWVSPWRPGRRRRSRVGGAL